MRRVALRPSRRKKDGRSLKRQRRGTSKTTTIFDISKDSRQFRVDVKSKKRVARKAGGVQEDLVWIEFRTVRDTKGWLFGSADLIAFETKNGFKIVERKALVHVINKLVKIHVKVDKPEDALYKVYTRKGRPDEITLIKTSDLDSILWDEWKIPSV